MKTLKKRVEIQLDGEEYRKVEELAKLKGKPVARIVREAVSLYHDAVSNEERKKAVKNIAGIQADMPSWDKVEKEIESKYEDR